MTKNIFLFLALLFAASSCNHLAVYDKRYDFDDSRWQKNDAKTFDFTIEDDTKTYDVIFSLSHIYGYQFDTIPLSFTWIQPDGTTQAIEFDYKLKDRQGKELGDCSGDICDIKSVVLPQQKMQKGKHQIVATHLFAHDYLPNIFQVGLEIDTAKH